MGAPIQYKMTLDFFNLKIYTFRKITDISHNSKETLEVMNVDGQNLKIIKEADIIYPNIGAIQTVGKYKIKCLLTPRVQKFYKSLRSYIIIRNFKLR